MLPSTGIRIRVRRWCSRKSSLYLRHDRWCRLTPGLYWESAAFPFSRCGKSNLFILKTIPRPPTSSFVRREAPQHSFSLLPAEHFKNDRFLVEFQILNLPSGPPSRIADSLSAIRGNWYKNSNPCAPLVVQQKVQANIMLETPSPHRFSWRPIWTRRIIGGDEKPTPNSEPPPPAPNFWGNAGRKRAQSISRVGWRGISFFLFTTSSQHTLYTHYSTSWVYCKPIS